MPRSRTSTTPKRSATAFEKAEAVYIMNPPAYNDPDMFARARSVHAALIHAAQRAKVGRIVALSSVGAQHGSGTGNILTTYDLEQQLACCTIPTIILRAANFIDNWDYALRPAQQKGILPSMFLPLGRQLPMQFSADVGTAAAALMIEGGAHRRIVELHGPAAVSPAETAAALERVLGRAVQAVPVPESEWAAPFRQRGLPERTVAGYCEMFAGFNSGHIVFEGTHETRHGATTLDDALRQMIAAQNTGTTA